MNKILLIILFFISPVFSHSQKCNYEKDKIDESTQLVIKRTAPLTLCKVNGHPFIFKSQQIGDRKYLKLRYYKYNNFSITEGSKFIFYFYNNKLMLYPLDFAIKQNSNQNGFSTISSMIVYELKKEDFETLLNNPVRMIAVYTKTGIIKQEIKSKQQNNIQHMLECIN